MKKGITNTTAETLTPKGVQAAIVETLAFGGGGAIERQEARGQAELVGQSGESVQLPTDGSEDAAFEAMGVKYGAPVDGDPIFRTAALPPGWKLKPTDHSMWSELTDAQGRTRAKIFYKAAYYDRSAHIYPVRRFNVVMQFERKGGDSPSRYAAVDNATGEVLHAGPWRAADDYTSGDADRQLCAALLEEKFPGHDDPAKHW